MEDKVKVLRAALERTFEIATLASQQRAVPAGGIVTMDAETKEAFTAIDDSIRGIVDGNLNPENRHCLPNESFMDDLRKVLAFRPFVTFEAWHPADNISDDEILAAEKTISHGTLAKLERFRDQNRKTDFFMALDETHATYKMVLNNLRYLLCLLAHQAKRYGSFPAARSFLSAASLVYRRTSEATPYFRDTDIENLVDQFNDGIDELQIAADYKNMEDWEPYRAREAERFAAAMKEREAVLGERGK